MSDKLIHRPVVSERLLDDPAQQPGLLHGLSLSSIGADALGNDGPGQRQPRLLHRGACPTPRVDHSRTSGPDVAAWVGPARGGRTIEVFATLVPPDTVTVFHRMDVRATTIAKLNGERA